MKYTVSAISITGYAKEEMIEVPRKSVAKTVAELKAEHGDCQIFVSWFRAADQCRGYLNPDGNHSPTGKAW